VDDALLSPACERTRHRDIPVRFLSNCKSAGADIVFIIESSHSNILEAQSEIGFLRLRFLWL
jgi:hypothetical protein